MVKSRLQNRGRSLCLLSRFRVRAWGCVSMACLILLLRLSSSPAMIIEEEISSFLCFKILQSCINKLRLGICFQSLKRSRGPQALLEIPDNLPGQMFLFVCLFFFKSVFHRLLVLLAIIIIAIKLLPALFAPAV